MLLVGGHVGDGKHADRVAGHIVEDRVLEHEAHVRIMADEWCAVREQRANYTAQALISPEAGNLGLEGLNVVLVLLVMLPVDARDALGHCRNAAEIDQGHDLLNKFLHHHLMPFVVLYI